MAGPSDRYAPPPPPDRGRAVGLALLVHALLIGAITWGVNWRDDPDRLNAEAELWSADVQQAAPRPVEAPPPPPAPPPQPTVQAPPPPPAPSEADIALQQREKEREAEERRRQEQLAAERQRRQQAEREEREREQRQAAEEARKREVAEQRRREEEKQRQLAEQKRREEAKRREALARQEREQQEARRVEQQREENLRRIQGLAGATGGPTATGTAQRSTGPSDSYAGRIRARVRPNIVFTDDVPGNPTTEVEVSMAPDGTITARRIVRSSGVRTWDEAVLRALDRTQVLPRDLDGRVHSPLLMEFRPKG